MLKKPHIIVVGAGLAGSTVIAALAHCAAKITLLERRVDNKAANHQDERPISLSYASIIFLKNLNLWDQLKKQACPIKSVHVSEQYRFGSLTLAASDAALTALGYVVPFHLLQNTIYHYALAQKNVECIAVNDIVEINESKHVRVSFETAQGRQTLQADFLIAADGVHSRCRSLLNITTKETMHHDVALTALLTLTMPHHHIAYERFTKHGVMALLPMWDRYQYRLVWTQNKAQCDALTDTELLSMVNEVFTSRIGHIDTVKRMGVYPLSTVLAAQQATKHCVLIGDSAHRIYPLAAQGYNLTVRDCALLVDIIAKGKSLSDYVQARQKDQKFIYHLTQSLEWVFGLELPLLDHLRAAALLKMDLLPPLKKRLILQILGRHLKQPQLLCEE